MAMICGNKRIDWHKVVDNGLVQTELSCFLDVCVEYTCGKSTQIITQGDISCQSWMFLCNHYCPYR